jgi:hypothetical protein
LEQRDIDRAADRARALLGPDAYAAAEHAVPTERQDRGPGQSRTVQGESLTGQAQAGC